jgi:hypothetical protein
VGGVYTLQTQTLEGMKWASVYGIGGPFQTV